MRFFPLPLLLLAALSLFIQSYGQDSTAVRKKKLTKQQQLQALKAPQTAIGNINEGMKDVDIVSPPSPEEFDKKMDTTERVDQPASYPTDNAGWQAFLQKVLTDSVYSDTTIQVGQYRTTLEIFIGADGMINQVLLLQPLGHGMDDRLIHGIMRSNT